MPLVDVADLTVKPTLFIGKRIGLLAVVLCLDQLHCALGDHAGVQQVIKVDMRQMKVQDRRRLVRECFYAPCSEILVGVMERDAFIATRAYDTKLPILPVRRPSTASRRKDQASQSALSRFSLRMPTLSHRLNRHEIC